MLERRSEADVDVDVVAAGHRPDLTQPLARRARPRRLEQEEVVGEARGAYSDTSTLPWAASAGYAATKEFAEIQDPPITC